jgi:hypothetical protein
MRMMFPTVRERRVVDRLLRAFFETYRQSDFRRAMRLICRFYNLKPPPVEWFEYLDWGKGAGRTYEDGTIHLVHPENWKRGRKYNSLKQWIHTVHHEIGHYVLWTDAERKADLFASGMMNGLDHDVVARSLPARPAARVRLTGTRRSVARRRNAS